MYKNGPERLWDNLLQQIYHVNSAEYDVVDRTEYKGITQKYVPTIESNERRWVDLSDIVHADTEISKIIEHLKNDASDDDALILDYYR